MLISYFDEVKRNATNQPYYWLTAITVSPTLVREMEGQVAALSFECFETPLLTTSTEFHATDIYSRSRNFKSWREIDERLAVLKRLFKILDRPGQVFKTHVRIDPSRMIKPEGIESWAFMFLVEKLNDLLTTQNDIGLLIGDYESEAVTNDASTRLSLYRTTSTPHYFGREITRLIDTVHFTRSHLSRMLQLADVFAWAIQFSVNGNHSEYPGSDLLAYLQNETELLIPTKYKEWPTERSWYPTKP